QSSTRRRWQRPPRSVSEVAAAGEDHGDAELVAGGDNLRVADRTTRLNQRGDTSLCGLIDAVTEWEEGVRGGDRAATARPSLFRSDAGRVYAAHLPCPDTDDHAGFREEDRVRL